MVEVRPGRQGNASINVIEVTPRGAVIAYAEPRGGTGGTTAGGEVRRGYAHAHMSPTSEDGSYTSSGGEKSSWDV